VDFFVCCVRAITIKCFFFLCILININYNTTILFNGVGWFPNVLFVIIIIVFIDCIWCFQFGFFISFHAYTIIRISSMYDPLVLFIINDTVWMKWLSVRRNIKGTWTRKATSILVLVYWMLYALMMENALLSQLVCVCENEGCVCVCVCVCVCTRGQQSTMFVTYIQERIMWWQNDRAVGVCQKRSN